MLSDGLKEALGDLEALSDDDLHALHVAIHAEAGRRHSAAMQEQSPFLNAPEYSIPLVLTDCIQETP